MVSVTFSAISEVSNSWTDSKCANTSGSTQEAIRNLRVAKTQHSFPPDVNPKSWIQGPAVARNSLGNPVTHRNRMNRSFNRLRNSPPAASPYCKEETGRSCRSGPHLLKSHQQMCSQLDSLRRDRNLRLYAFPSFVVDSHALQPDCGLSNPGTGVVRCRFQSAQFS